MTIKPIYRSLPIVFLLFFCIACEKEKDSTPELFEESNKPSFVYNTDDDSYLLTPWNYETTRNADRAYPLLVYLHGRGYNGTPPSFVGYENDDFKMNHPCFVYMPHSDGQYNVDNLQMQIENLISNNRIHKSRIYLVGYSMGAYWAAPLANKLKDSDTYFAGIVSQAGLSNNCNYEKSVLDKTSIWVHVGEQDGNYVNSQNRLNLIKEHFTSKGATISSEHITIGSIPKIQGVTETVSYNNRQIIKNTVYKDVGHGVSHFPFKNPEVITWLFSQNIDFR